MIRVLLIESHELVRQALASRLTNSARIDVVGSTGYYEHAVQQARALHPDIILLEIKTPVGLETLRALHQTVPESTIVVLTSYLDTREEERAYALGAARYLLKTLNTAELIHQICHLALEQVPA